MRVNARDMPNYRDMGRWTRIPLIGDVSGIVLLLPDKRLSLENWDQFMRSLEVMKPGLVDDPPAEGDETGG